MREVGEGLPLPQPWSTPDPWTSSGGSTTTTMTILHWFCHNKDTNAGVDNQFILGGSHENNGDGSLSMFCDLVERKLEWYGRLFWTHPSLQCQPWEREGR